MRRGAVLVLSLALAVGIAGGARAAEVDPRVVGVWAVEVPGGGGTVRWIWSIDAGGRYDFHSDPSGAAPAHSGTVRFREGQWRLQADAGLRGWTDGGTYRLDGADSLVATGRLGKGVWHRIAAAPSLPPAPPPAGLAEPAPPPAPALSEPAPSEARAPEPAPPQPAPQGAAAEATAPPPPSGPAAPSAPPAPSLAALPPPTLPPAALRERLLAVPTAGLSLPRGFRAVKTAAVAPSPAEAAAGVVEKVEIDYAGPENQSGYTLFLVFADRAAAARGDPEAAGLVFDLSMIGRDGAASVYARCFLWQPEEARSGVRCAEVDDSLPVVVVGAVLQPFAFREITLGAQARVPGQLLQAGMDLLAAAGG